MAGRDESGDSRGVLPGQAVATLRAEPERDILLPDGVSGAWDLASSTTLPDGALGLPYQRR
jgi:hypothetical protein